MAKSFIRRPMGLVAPVLALIALAGGCQSLATVRSQNPEEEIAVPEPMPLVARPETSPVPTEKSKSSLPSYVIEPPDILLIDAVRIVPKAPYRSQPNDVLSILVSGTLLGQDIAGPFPVDPAGFVNLGPSYGKVKVGGLTIDESTEAVEKHLRRVLKAPEVSISLLQYGGQQQIGGEHLVGPDGTINMGTYGRVYVSGMTLEQARAAVEEQLSKSLENPKVSVDVFAYNSKVYYIIVQTGGFGDQLIRVPVTGNETVLDALANINGTTRASSKKIWIARPAPSGMGCDQILNVNWHEITAGAATQTNYQVLPGDRVFVAESKFIAMDGFIQKVTGPFERLLGFSLLGAQTIQTFNRFPDGLQGGQSF
jgi:polysaccharide export outer membrane protein